jgi:hypothetical protein
MMLIVYYVIFMSAGLFADYFIGLFVEREFGKPSRFSRVLPCGLVALSAAFGLDDRAETCRVARQGAGHGRKCAVRPGQARPVRNRIKMTIKRMAIRPRQPRP